MIPELFVLALASTIRPTSLAAVSTLLGRESSRRLLLAYVIGGLTFIFVFGLVVVGVFHGIHIHAGSGETKGIADIVGGAAVLVFGVAVLTGGLARSRPAPSSAGRGWVERLDRRLTVRVAALAGPLTHIPGVFYLVALNVIVAHHPRAAAGVLAVAIYDGLWFAVPIAALTVCIVDPERARAIIEAVQAWTRRHARAIVLTTSFVVGAALVVRGLLTL